MLYITIHQVWIVIWMHFKLILFWVIRLYYYQCYFYYLVL